MLKGHVFNLQTFTSECFALFIDTFLNKNNGVVKGCELSHTNNSVTINAGFFVVKGRFLEIISSETADISENGFYKLIYEMDLSQINTTTELKQACIKVVRGITDYQDLIQNDTVFQYEFARFRIEDNAISDFIDKRTFIDIQSIYDYIENESDSLLNQIETALKNVLDGSAYVLKDGGSIDGEVHVEDTGDISGDISANARKC